MYEEVGNTNGNQELGPRVGTAPWGMHSTLAFSRVVYCTCPDRADMRLCKHAVFAALAGGVVCAVAPLGSQTTAPAPDPRKILDQYCVNCHNQKLRTAGLELDRIDPSKPAANA